MLKQKMKSCGALLAGLMLTGLGLCGLTPAAQAAAGDISTIAGNGSIGFSGDGGSATSAQFYFPHAVAVDGAGNTYICDRVNKRVRKVAPGGIISTFAGNGTENVGRVPGPATSIALVNPTGVLTDSSNNVYIADSRVVVKVDTTGYMTLFAGNGTRGDGGQAVGAFLSIPTALAKDRLGNIYIAEYGGHKVRKVAPNGIISTVAGNGQGGFSGDGGPATSATLYGPRALAVDSAGNLYIAEYARVRKVNTSGIISTYAGTGDIGFNGDNIPSNTAQLWDVGGLAVDSKDNLYISVEQNNRVRKVVNGLITTFAGTGEYGFSGDGQPAAQARVSAPRGIWIDSSDNLFITDYGNSRIRKVDAKDDPSPTIFTVSDVTRNEGNSGTQAYTFTVSRIGDINKVSSVTYATTDDSATAGSDYTAAGGSFSFAVGESSKTVDVTVSGDFTVEGNETFHLALSNPLNANLAAPGYGVGTINNDDRQPYIYSYWDDFMDPFIPSSGFPGDVIRIYGYYFDHVNGVSFNGIPATSFTVDNGEQITAVVPAGATTGPVTVYAPGTSTTSADDFTVIVRTASVVNTTSDAVNENDGVLSLREALLAADGNQASIITFDPTVFSSAKSISVGSPLTVQAGNVVITGPAAGVTVTGTGASFNIFEVNSGATAAFNRLTVSGGDTGFSNAGTLTVSNSTLSENGTGLSNLGTLTVSNSTLSGNSTGLSNSGNLTVSDSTLAINSTAISNNGGTVAASNSLFAANGANPFQGFADPGAGGDTNKNFSFATAAVAGLETDGSGKALLANNGGPTKTIALKSGSPVIDKGNSTLATDQRGATRSGNGGSDIGAYEVQQSQKISRFDTQRGPVGTFVIISGQSLGEATSVRFNGTPAPFTVVSATRLITNVPAGATSGALSVTTPDGTISSSGSLTPLFTVTPALGVTGWGSSNNPRAGLAAQAPSGLTGVKALAAGRYFSLALKSDGTVVAWGINTDNEGNSSGQLNVPAGLSGVVAIAAGDQHSLALKSDGTIVAWGGNTFGQSTVPAGLGGVVAIAAGGNHSLALKSDGSVVAWGQNDENQNAVPAGLGEVVGIAAGSNHGAALKSDGTVVAWGSFYYGSTQVPAGLSNVVSLAAGGFHNLVLKSDGTIAGWGYVGNAEGDGPLNPPANLNGIVAVAAGGYHNAILRKDGTVGVWGDYYEVPRLPTNMRGVVALAAGGFHDVAIVAPLSETLSLSAVSSPEGNTGNGSAESGTNYLRFPVTLSAASFFDVTVSYQVGGGSAAAGSDYIVPTSTSLTIPAGQTSASIVVPILGDKRFEATETFNVALTAASNANLSASATGVGTITNDDQKPSVSINSVSQSEGNTGTTALNFTVSLSVPNDSDTVVPFSTQNGSGTTGATAGSDFVGVANGSVTIPAGQGSATLAVTLSGDTTTEADETFSVVLGEPTSGNATLSPQETGVGTIFNDDVATTPTATVPSGVTVIKSGFTRSRGTNRLVQTVIVQNNSGAALAGPVYLALDGLSGGTLYGAAGTTVLTTPAGSAYRLIAAQGNILPTGATTIYLEFVTSGSSVSYTPRVLQGPGAP